MKKRSKYKDTLRAFLQENGLYSERNEPLIEKADDIMHLIERTEDELRKNPIIMTTTGVAGQEKKQLNPALPYITRLHADHARILWYLGLGNKLREANEDTDSVQTAQFNEFMSMMDL